MQKIPTHQFVYDDETSIPFRLEKLNHQNNYDIEHPHRHNYYEVFLFENGGGNHIIDFNPFEITPNTLHFLTPGQVHQVNRAGNANGYVIMFSREFTHEAVNQSDFLYQLPFFNVLSDLPVIELAGKEFLLIHQLFDQMREEFDGFQLYNKEILQNYLNILLLKCKQLYKAPNVVENIDATPEKEIVYQFIRLVEEFYAESRKVKDYAEKLDVNPDQLNKWTQTFIGKKASECIQERIMLEAKRLLLHTSYSAKEIGYTLNFTDPAHFSKFFKTHTGYSPQEFKNQAKEIYKYS